MKALSPADKAAIENAKLNLTYCYIKSPIDGRVGLRQVDPGNYVTAAGGTPMLVITQLHPIAVCSPCRKTSCRTYPQAHAAGTLGSRRLQPR